MRYLPSPELEPPDPQNRNPYFHHKKGNLENILGNESGDNKPTLHQDFAQHASQRGARTVKTNQPGSQGELKDGQQLFPFLLRPGEEMGLHWTGRDLGWYMEGFLTEGNAFS